MKPLTRPFVWICLAMVLIISVWLTPSSASSLTDSRINQLEFKVRSLQTQLNRLENQTGNVHNSSAPARAINATPGLDEPSLDEQFDNLATLVIEINQRVIALENER